MISTIIPRVCGKYARKSRRTASVFSDPVMEVASGFLARLASDPDVHDNDIRALLGVIDHMTKDGRWRGSDEDLEKDTTVAVKSQPACLARLVEAGYLCPLTRKKFGQRDLTLAANHLPALRRRGRSGREEIKDDSATQRNSQQALPVSEEGSRNEETPEQKESLTRTRKPRKRQEIQGGSESLDPDSSPSNKDKPAGEPRKPNAGEQKTTNAERHSLSDLAARYGVEHFPQDVLEAAVAFDDLQGAPHYNMVYTTMADSDQDLWGEVVLEVLTRWRAGEIDSPRPYLATTLQGTLDQRAVVLSERQRLAKKGLFRTPTVVSALPPSRAEFDALILVDPFADDAADDAADGEDGGWEQPEELTPDQPEDAPADGPAEDAAEPSPAPTQIKSPKGNPEPVPAPAAAPAPAPSVVRPRPFAAKKPVPAPAQGDPAVLADAARRLGLDTEANNLGSLYSGVCKGRLEVFLLAVRMAELAQAKHPNSFVAKVAAENVGKDAQWLRDRTDGLTAADCTEELKKFEARLEEFKAEDNRPMTKMGGFRSDTPAGIGAVIDTLPFDKGTPQDGGLALPTTPRGWADLQAQMTAMRGKYNALSAEEQKECDDAGTALACAKVQRDHTAWADWRKLGTFHAVCALVDAKARAANVEAARETVSEDTPPLG